jgi:serine/threonine protein kinase, bacterial
MPFTRVVSTVVATAAVTLSAALAGCSAAASTAAQHAGGAASTSGTAPGPAMLDGTYQIETKYSQGSFEGSPLSGGSDVSRWYAFRSACTPSGCTAAATQLDNDAHDSTITNGATATLRLVSGKWQTITPIEGTMPCKADANVKLKVVTSWSFKPRGDGTLAGAKYYTEMKGGGTGDCTGSGMTVRYPITLTRVGAVPAGVDVAEPPHA